MAKIVDGEKSGLGSREGLNQAPKYEAEQDGGRQRLRLRGSRLALISPSLQGTEPAGSCPLNQQREPSQRVNS